MAFDELKEMQKKHTLLFLELYKNKTLKRSKRSEELVVWNGQHCEDAS